MTIRDQVQAIISKPFEQYNMHDVVELSRLKMKVGGLVADAENKYLVAEQEYKQRKNDLYILYKQSQKATDKSCEAEAMKETVKEKTKVIQFEGKLKELKNYYNDLNDVLIAVRMCQRRYDDSVNTQT